MSRLLLIARRIRAKCGSFAGTDDRALLKNMSWLTAVSGVERFAGVIQTILIARALGIATYGVYGLIFGTVGLVASTAGMQMGLTATVFVARYRQSEKARTAYVISFVSRFGFAVSLGFLACTLPFSRPISHWLLGSNPSAQEAVIAGCLLVALSIVSGIQDGIIQGFEDFRATALARLATTLITVMLVYPAGVRFGLIGVLGISLSGPLAKFAYLARQVKAHRRLDGLPRQGDGLSARHLLWSFSIPSVLASCLTGLIGWSGSIILSRQVNGYEGLAIVSTGLQWRGPILLIASIVSTIAVPAISRHYQRLDHGIINQLLWRMIAFNGAVALLASIGLIAASPIILALYGPGFTSGGYVFAVLVLSSLPQVISGVFMQNLVAKGRMWEQLLMYLYLVLPLAVGYATLVPRYHGMGFAVTQVIAWSVMGTALFLHGKVSGDQARVELPDTTAGRLLTEA